jgi:predicted outer membrane protein
MKNTVMVFSTALLLVFAGPAWVFAQNLAPLLDQANQMNNEEEDMAKDLRSKAGDNQALITLADTMEADHKANQSAVEALANQKNIKLKSYEKNTAAEDKLANLKGADYNREVIKMNIHDHEQALASFRRAKTQYGNDPDVLIYIDQTIPVLEAHLKMVQNLHHDDKMLGSRENSSNNKD